MTSIRIPQLVSFLFSSIAAVAQSLPEPPTLWREVTGIINTTVTDPSGTQKTVPVYRQAHVPSYRTTVDGRVALRVLNDGGFALMMPEKLSAPVRLASADNNPVNNSYAMSSTASPKFVDGCKSAKENVAKFHSAQGNGSVGHFTLFDPTPLQSTGGVVGNPSCDDFGSDVYKLKVFAIFNYDPSHQLHPNKMQFFVTPVTVIVDKPKTKDANIKSVTTSGAPVAGPIYHFQAAGNEPNIVGDGRLLVLRIGATKLPWTNPITGVGQQKPVDIVYSYYEGGDPADPRMWTNLHPITHAPHDPRINGKFGFAMNRFRDPSGREIPDGADLGGTYPWIDRQAKNLFFNVVSETLRYSVPNSQGKDDWSDPRNSRYEQRKLAGDPDLDGSKEEASKTRGICFAGLWSHGKVVLLDNLNNDMDYAMGDGTKLGAREVRLFDPTQFEAAPNHREWLHLGAGRVNNADAMPAGEHKNNTVMDSLENVFNYRKFAEPISIGEVVWPLHNGKHSDDLVVSIRATHLPVAIWAWESGRMNLPTRRKRRTPEEINAVAERYWQSGLTQRAFAEAEGVCVATLAKYLRLAVELRRRSAGPAQADATTLVEVRRQATGTFAGPFAGEHLRISFPNGTALEMAAPGRELGALLRELFALR